MKTRFFHVVTALFLLFPAPGCGRQAPADGKSAAGVPKARPTPTLEIPSKEPPPTPVERFSAKCRALKPLEVGGTVLSPRKREAPPWTLEESATRKLSGQILMLDAVLDAKGEVCDAILVKSLDPALDADMLKWAGKLKYDPATLDGKPVACLFRISILLDL
jgi:hypothetical protein